MNTKPVVIGYWKVKGKGHILRMLLEYLHITYEQVQYESPQAFFKNEKQIAHLAQNLPYLKDGDNVVFDLMPCFIYITQKHNNQEILGKTVKDQAIVDMFDWDIQYLFKKLLSSSFWKLSANEKLELQHKVLNENVVPLLQKCQDQLATINQKFYLGYLSIIDFHLYSLVNYAKILFPGKLEPYPRLLQLAKNITNIPQILALQNKPKVKQLCTFPTQLLRSFRAQSQN